MAGPIQSLDDLDRGGQQQPSNEDRDLDHNSNWFKPFKKKSRSRSARPNDAYSDGINDLPPARNDNRSQRGYPGNQMPGFDPHESIDNSYYESQHVGATQYYDKELQKIRIENAKFALSKKRSFFTLQIFMGYSLAILLMAMIVTFVGLFMYVTFHEGMLSESGMGSAILQTIQEIFRILFTSEPGY